MAAKNDGYIRWRCRACGQKLKVKESFEGGNVIQCPRCGANVNVPVGNIEAVAAGADMPETGQPGRIQLSREKLMRTLRGDDKEPGTPGSAGSTPSLRETSWDPTSAFGRLEQLDQLAASLVKIDQATMGEVQRLFRNRDLGSRERQAQVKNAADSRREEIKRLVQNRLAGLRMKLGGLEGSRERLMRSQLDELERIRLGIEALELYTRYILGIEL